MSQVVVFAEPRRLTIELEEERPLGSHEVRLRTAFSGISAGAELTAYRGSNPYLHQRWDAGRRLFVPGADTSMSFPVVGFGYEELGIFSQIAAIALNGVHDAAIRVGETVAVFGLGTPGQIIAQLARRSGATVVGVDPIPLRRRMAYQLGAIDHGSDPSTESVAERIKELTEGRGADVCVAGRRCLPPVRRGAGEGDPGGAGLQPVRG